MRSPSTVVPKYHWSVGLECSPRLCAKGLLPSLVLLRGRRWTLPSWSLQVIAGMPLKGSWDPSSLTHSLLLPGFALPTYSSHDVLHRPKAVGPIDHEASKTVNQNKPIFFINWLCQVFCHSYGIWLTQMLQFMWLFQERPHSLGLYSILLQQCHH
jgi:hypothetical protein